MRDEKKLGRVRGAMREERLDALVLRIAEVKDISDKLG
jgi:hypothetical protein